MDFEAVLRQRHYQSRLFFELQLSVEEQNWGTAYECAARCVTSQLPAAHRVYLLAVAFKAASESAKQGVDDAETERWCRIGFCSSTTAEERHRFGALLVRASLDAGKWEEAMAAARVLMKRMTTAADPTSLIALLAATTAAKSLAGEKAEKELFSILQELSSNLEAVPEESIVHVAKRVVAVIDGLREGRVALSFLDAAVATAIHHKRTKWGKFLLFNLSYRISRGLSNSAFDALVSYVQWFVAYNSQNKYIIAQSSVHEDVVRLCDSQIDNLISISCSCMSNKGDCVEEVSNELDIVLKWCDAAICLSQQAEDVAAIQNFLAKKLLVLLNTRNIKTAKSVMSDYKDVVHDENPLFLPILVRAAVLDKDLAAVEKLLNRLTKSKDVSETDPYAAIVGLLIESGDVLVMNDIADLLERMMYARSGTESGAFELTVQLLIRTKLQQWLSAEDEDGNSALAMARVVDMTIDAGCSEELRVWMAKTTWNMAVQSKHHLARYTLLAVAASCLQGDQALQRLNCRVVQLASLLAAVAHRGSGVGRNMLEDASIASDDCFGILTELEAEDNQDDGIIRRKRILLIYRVKLAMIGKNMGVLSDLIDRCTADPNVDALTMTLIIACINSEEYHEAENASPSELRSLRTMGLKGALAKHLQCLRVGREKTGAITAPRAKTVVGLFHSLIQHLISEVGSEGVAVERLCDDLVSFLKMVATPDWPQKECARLLVELWNRGVELSLNRKKRDGDRLKRASRKLAYFATDYTLFFADKLNNPT